MKFTKSNPEIVKFNEEKYRQKARNMTPDALWWRQCLKYRTKVSSGCGIAFSGIMLVPTLGVSTVGLWISGRTLDIARRKEKIIDEEVERRHLPPYELKKRDTLIPLGVSLAVIATVGAIDLVCLAGTSTAVVNGVAPHGFDALGLAFHHPGEFLAAAWSGFKFQGQQFLHLHHVQVAVGTNKLVENGQYGFITENAFTGYAAAPVATVASVKGQFASIVHQILAGQNGVNAAHTAVADEFIQSLACNPANAAPLAGVNAGMAIGQMIQVNVARLLVKSVGLQSRFTGLIRKTPQQGLTEEDDDEAKGSSIDNKKVVEVPNIEYSPEAAEKLFNETLTGKSSRPFVFLSKRGQVQSQCVMAHCKSWWLWRLKPDIARTVTCHFCRNFVHARTEPYYQCLECSGPGAPFRMCETCVAGRGCSCSERSKHILQRRGKLTATVLRGNLTDIEVTKVQKLAADTKAGSKKSWTKLTSGWEWTITSMRKKDRIEQIAADTSEKISALIDKTEKDNVAPDDDDDDADSVIFFDTKT